MPVALKASSTNFPTFHAVLLTIIVLIGEGIAPTVNEAWRIGKTSVPDPANFRTFMNTKIWRLISSVFLLLAFALAAASCDGFFVDPTLTSVSVGPQNLSI